jgi:hypothetical protein
MKNPKDAVSPVEPVSTQSSTFDNFYNQRQKYALRSTSKRQSLKEAPLGTEMIVETVSRLKEAASASITDLKEWGCHTNAK